MTAVEQFVRRGGYVYGWIPGASLRTVRQVCTQCHDLNPRSDGRCSCPATEAELHAAALQRVFERRRHP